MIFLYKYLIQVLLIVIFFAFFTSNARAALTQGYDTISITYKVDNSICQNYSNFVISCNNGSTVGDPGTCGTNICTGGNTWSKYSFTQCYSDPNDFGSYIEYLVFSSNVCSTADKYNSVYPSANPPGDLTMLRAGQCDCSAGELFKTCCNGTTVVNTYNYTSASGQGNPNFPDGACAYTTMPCGTDPSIYAALGYPYTGVSCGTQACAPLGTPPPVTPPPSTCAGVSLTCSNPQCPSGYTVVKLSTGNYACYNNSTGTIDCNTAPYCQGPCPSTGGWTGQSCSGPSAPNISQTCSTDSTTCSKCSAAVCTLYDPSTNLYCYYNNGTCYVDYVACKGFGNCGTCIPGSTKIECSTPNYCPTP